MCAIEPYISLLYVRVKNKLLSLGVSVNKLDPSVFIWHNEGNLEGVMCTTVDDFFLPGDPSCLSKMLSNL